MSVVWRWGMELIYFQSSDLSFPPFTDTSFHDFVEHPVMKEIKERSIFIHVDLPGQEDDAANLPEE